MVTVGDGGVALAESVKRDGLDGERRRGNVRRSWLRSQPPKVLVRRSHRPWCPIILSDLDESASVLMLDSGASLP